MHPLNIFTESYKSVVKVENTDSMSVKKKEDVKATSPKLETTHTEILNDTVKIESHESAEVRESELVAKQPVVKTDESHASGEAESYDTDGRMTRQNLWKIAKHATELYNLLSDSDDLEPWFQEKIAVASEMIDTVTHYMEYEKTSSKPEAKCGCGPKCSCSTSVAVPEPTPAVVTVEPITVTESDKEVKAVAKSDEIKEPLMAIKYTVKHKKFDSKKTYSGTYPSVEALYDQLKEQDVSPNNIHIVSVHSAHLRESLKKMAECK